MNKKHINIIPPGVLGYLIHFIKYKTCHAVIVLFGLRRPSNNSVANSGNNFVTVTFHVNRLGPKMTYKLA